MDIKKKLHDIIVIDSDIGLLKCTGLKQDEIAVEFALSDLFVFVVNLIADIDANLSTDMLDLLIGIEHSGVTMTDAKAENLAEVISYVWNTEVSFAGFSEVDVGSGSYFSMEPSLEFKMSREVLAKMDAEYTTVSQ